MEKTLKARSSDGHSSYSVWFTFADGSLTIDCNCPAGELGKSCKHKLAFLLGKKDMLFCPEENGILAELQAWVNQTSYPELIRQIDHAEVELRRAQEKVKRAKSMLERAMKHGSDAVGSG